MASYEENDHSRRRANSLPESGIKKVTIQQTMVTPASTCVARTAYVENNRRYPKVEFHDPSNRGHRGKYAVNPSRGGGGVMATVNGFESKTEERNEATSRKTGERDLWEKAVRELELIITDKDAAVDNLSKVNRKLADDIQWYERTLMDNKDTFAEMEARLQEATGDNRDLSWYEKVLREREIKIRELEEKLKEMVKPVDAKDRRSLELSQGAKSVLKNLELRKEKKELERKVEELEKELKVKEVEKELKVKELEEELNIQKKEENNNSIQQDGGQLLQHVTSILSEFQVAMDTNLQEKMATVGDFDSRLSRCLLKFDHLSEKVRSREKQKVEEIISQKSSAEVSSQPESKSPRDVNPGDINPVDMSSGDIINTNDLRPRGTNPRGLTPRDLTPRGLNPGGLNPGDLNPRDLNQGEVNASPFEEQLSYMKDALQKERKINDEIIERFLELEDSNAEHQDTIEALRDEANLVEDLRTHNESLVREMSEVRERENCLEKDSSTQGNDSVDGGGEQKGTDRDIMKEHEEQLHALRAALETRENEMNDLREKADEDDELIEELRANFQREEKWNREMKRKHEWELSSNVGKDEHIEELQECLWTREKMLEQLQEQLEFEDKRCEELLEKLVASQKEAQDFEEITDSFQKKLQEKEKSIKEFCEQNDHDAVAIATLTSENKQLRKDVESAKKAQEDLEEEMERMSSSVETVEQNKEEFLTRREEDIKELAVQLKEEEFMSKEKDETIKHLRETVVAISGDVEEMEFKMEETRATLEEELRKDKENVVKRVGELSEASERYKELQEVCNTLRERISQKDDQIWEREADIARQREDIEMGEKQLEELRGMCGDATRLNNKPALVYTEQEMNEANQFLEQEKEMSEKRRTQIELLENEVKNSKNNFLEVTRKFEEEHTTREELHASNDLLEKTREELGVRDNLLEKTREELQERTDLLEKTREELQERTDLLEKTREELHANNDSSDKTREELRARNDLLEKTREESNARNVEVLKQNDKLIFKENELESYKEKLMWLQSKVSIVDEEKAALQATVDEGKKKSKLVDDEVRELSDANEQLKREMIKVREEAKRGECVNGELREELEKVTGKWFKKEEELRVANVSNVNLKYSLEEHISQSREQNFNLRNYEKELEALRKHIHEMDVLVSGFRSALEEAVVKERASGYESCKTESIANSDTDENCMWSMSSNDFEGSTMDRAGTPVITRDTEGTHVTARDTAGTHVITRDTEGTPVTARDTAGTHGITRDTEGKPVITRDTAGTYGIIGDTEGTPVTTRDTAGTPVIKWDTAGTHGIIGDTTRSHMNTGNTKGVPTESLVNKDANETGDNVDVAKQPTQQHSTTTPPLSFSVHSNMRNGGISHLKTEIPQTMNCPTNSAASNSSSYKEVLQMTYKSFVENRILVIVLGILFFVFLFGCMDTSSIVARKHLFVIVNSVVSLTTFVLWRYEVHVSKRFQEKNVVKFQENHRDHFSETISESQHCEDGMRCRIREDDQLRYGKMKSSFQDLHEKFLEAVESSSKDMVPIQELYNQYEKLKAEVETMRKDRVKNDAMSTPCYMEEKKSERVLAPKWNGVIQTLGRVLIIVLLCEIFYIRATPLPQFLKPLTFLVTSLVLSYLFDTICVRERNARTHAGQNVKEIAREIDELNEIIDREHELVTTQRDAIKALEKRLRKEFERRIKQRNVLLKQLKYKGKLEDLRELLQDDAGDSEERKGGKQKNRSRNNNIASEKDRMKKLHDILTRNCAFSSDKPRLNLDISFSPMFFLLGLPLTGIMLSCRYLALAALMIIAQAAIFFKESKYIDIEMLPKFFQKEISPVVMDTVVVLYACLLAVCLQCSQGIVVLVTCSIVQLSMYWWNCYRLAKSDDTLHEISICLPESEEEFARI